MLNCSNNTPIHTTSSSSQKLTTICNKDTIQRTSQLFDQVSLNGLTFDTTLLENVNQRIQRRRVKDNSNTYNGQLFKDQKPTLETIIYPNGDKYVGEIKNGLRHGKGTITVANGETTEAHWVEGRVVLKKKRDRQGALTDTSDDNIENVNLSIQSPQKTGMTPIAISKKNVKNWFSSSIGILHDTSGGIYYGTVESNEKQGFGYMLFENGNQYLGNWEKGQISGNGTFIYPNGDTFVGEFKDGVRHGKGTLTSQSGYQYVGVWVEGRASF